MMAMVVVAFWQGVEQSAPFGGIPVGILLGWH
jgi:hypothetical protein